MCCIVLFFFFKQKTAYEMRISDWSSDVCSSDLDALKYFTRFGSSEFAVRHFLRDDLARTLKAMHDWAHDPNEHVRRLASEGSRPRLPWSFHLEPIQANPDLAPSILEALTADSSLYDHNSWAIQLHEIPQQTHPTRLACMKGRPQQ